MHYPDFMMAFPALDLPFPEDLVSARAIRSEQGLVVYFAVHGDVEVPEHSHGAQWGALFEGSIELTVAGETRHCRPGDTWSIPAGTLYAAKLTAGSLLMDVFEEPDRYPLKPA